MKIFGIVVMVALIVAVAAETCPDGSNCDGECCKRFIVGSAYWCCRGIFQCKRFLGVGYCFLFSEPVSQNSSLAISTSEEEHDVTDVTADDSSASDEHRSELSVDGYAERSSEPGAPHKGRRSKKIIHLLDKILQSPADPSDVSDASEDDNSENDNDEDRSESLVDGPLLVEKSHETRSSRDVVSDKLGGLVLEILRSPGAEDMGTWDDVGFGEKAKDSPVKRNTADGEEFENGM